LNQKVGLKFFRVVDFVSRFVLLIKFKFKIYTFNNYYESRYKINGSKKNLNLIFNSKGFEPPHLNVPHMNSETLRFHPHEMNGQMTRAPQTDRKMPPRQRSNDSKLRAVLSIMLPSDSSFPFMAPDPLLVKTLSSVLLVSIRQCES
jgi:hypothetical protein